MENCDKFCWSEEIQSMMLRRKIVRLSLFCNKDKGESL